MNELFSSEGLQINVLCSSVSMAVTLLCVDSADDINRMIYEKENNKKTN